MAVKIALAGNPNSGKTTLFNALTGSNQFVGNWPGVTVEKKEGRLKDQKDVTITDLPGIYSLSPYTLEEVVARNYLIHERPEAILNIVDGTNLERNLYLTTQLLELGIPVVVAVNMIDVVNKNGDQINTQQLAKALGCEVVTISALKQTGIQEAAGLAVKWAKQGQALPPVHRFSPKVEKVLDAILSQLPAEIPSEMQRFYAIKLFERDDKITAMMNTVPDVGALIQKAEDELDDDAESIITNERYNYIGSIIHQCYTKKNQSRMSVSDKIDSIVTNRWLALPIFILVMALVYAISMGGWSISIGTLGTDWANDVLFGEWVPGAVDAFLRTMGVGGWLASLIQDGMVAGVVSVPRWRA